MRYPLTWTCHICGKERPDNKIDVVSADISLKYGLETGTMIQNVRYCNDNPACYEQAKIKATE